jgi:hypothetical protein
VLPMGPPPTHHPGARGVGCRYVSEGSDFLGLHNFSAVDFAAYHLHYIDWAPASSVTWQADFVRRFMRAHAEHAERTLRKPLILEEFSAV